MVCFVRGVCACVMCLRVVRVVYCVMLYGFCVCCCLCGCFVYMFV